MSTSNLPKLGEYETSLMNEISALSTFKPATVRTIIESIFLRQIEELLSGKDLDLPFIGKMHITYNGDNYVSGAKISDITCNVDPSDLFKRLVGEVHDGHSSIIQSLSEQKIASALQRKLDD